ncbi:MAG: sensor histidine kinase [Pseudorhodobacter sp. PARRP1]|nr:MAG: sensor histidine kinase [Pseudorhodobacter sp. PARRP1]
MTDAALPSTPMDRSAVTRAQAFGRNVVKLGLGYAATYFVVSSVVWGLAGYDPIATAPGKLIGMVGDAVLANIITLVLWRMRHVALGYKALVGCGLSLGLSPISGLIDWGFHAYCVYPQPVPFHKTIFAQVVLFTTSELFGWSCLYLALQYSDHVRAVEQRVAAVRQEALAAQMRALQYQVSPHFLFNTLNAVAGLVEENASAQAHEMLLGLASFLRHTVMLNPDDDIRLADELTMQFNYLGIEKVRFSDRMIVRTDIQPGLDDLLVPPLILQPLVENAVKYGISQMQGPAALVIGLRQDPVGVLRLWVENAVPPGGAAQVSGLGIGLENVNHRLQARWPGRCSCIATQPTADSFRVEMTMPMVWGRT